MSDVREGREPRNSSFAIIRRVFHRNDHDASAAAAAAAAAVNVTNISRKRATLGILADHETDEVPGTIKLLTNSIRNEPLGSERAEALQHERQSPKTDYNNDEDNDDNNDNNDTKKTPDGKIVLNPQPENTPNDPLNWSAWRRDCALLSLGFYCMLGGGMTPVLAAGFNIVAKTYGVSYSQVALTTGLYMMGLGVGSVIASPTAILFGKRPVYLLSSILFILSSVWCAAAPNYVHLVVGRVFQGIAVSPVECLPSATIAEIFFLHERAFRVGIYTLLLLGGKNLIPLVSAAIIQSLGWRWVFWIVAVVVGFGAVLLFLFVPETFWDRTPRSRKVMRSMNASQATLASRFSRARRPSLARRDTTRSAVGTQTHSLEKPIGTTAQSTNPTVVMHEVKNSFEISNQENSETVSDSPHEPDVEQHDSDPLPQPDASHDEKTLCEDLESSSNAKNCTIPSSASTARHNPAVMFTSSRRNSPALSYMQTLRPWNGVLSPENWFRAAVRPFILFAYPAVLWSSMVYAFSVGWLIVLSEAVAHVYEDRETYNFTAIQIGLVYLSPFIGGVLGTAVAGRFSDVVVRFMARRNNGIYEPEYRLIMAIPMSIATAMGLMGFGWSAEERDNFMVPTVFFGVMSFGCCMGSTTAITFVVDSYRQFAAEALVTLNFSKNILHGLVWSLFFPQWLQSDGSKLVFLAIGGIHLACMLLTIPMYMYGKRARMWTVRMKMMERF